MSITAISEPPELTISYHKKQWKRSKNYEESSFFTTNFFFCFYFPYICRIAPLLEDDVPVPAQEDRSDVTIEKLRAKWNPLYSEYTKKLAEHLQDKSHPLPKQPSLLRVVLSTFTSPTLIWSLICCAIGFPFLFYSIVSYSSLEQVLKSYKVLCAHRFSALHWIDRII